MLNPHNHPVESHGRTALRNYIIQASTLLEITLSGLVLIGLLFSIVPLLKWMPGLLFDGNDAEIRTFLERALDIVIGIEFIKMLAKHSPGSSLEVLLYAIARHMVVGHESALENLLSVGAIALIFIVRKFFFVPAFGAHLPRLPAAHRYGVAGQHHDGCSLSGADAGVQPHARPADPGRGGLHRRRCHHGRHGHLDAPFQHPAHPGRQGVPFRPEAQEQLSIKRCPAGSSDMYPVFWTLDEK